MRRTEARTSWVAAPRSDRLPPPAILRVTTAGRKACSARQLVASRLRSKRNEKVAGNSTLRCAANRSTSATELVWLRMVPSAPISRPPGDGHAVGRHGARVVAVAQDQRLAEQGMDRAGESRVRMILAQEPGTPQQVRQTGLMRGVRELAVRRPALSHEHAAEVRAEDRGGFRKAASFADRIDRGVGRREGPQPVQAAGHAPPGFIRGDHGAAAHRLAQGLVRRRGLARGTMAGANDGAARQRESEALVEQGGDLAEGDAELFIERHGARDRVRPELDGRGAERVGRLPRMTALDPTVALRAAADVDAKTARHRAHRRQIFLILIGHARLAHDAPTVRTPGRERLRRGSRRGGAGTGR